ncbi:Uncharacterised protein [Aeromonas hydrophila]|nr:Uncharacterised protein [Aeromonas hydrophila]
MGGGKGKALHGEGLEPAPGRPLPRQRFVAGLCVVLGLPAQALQQVGNGDAHRAHLAAGAAQARGGHQILGAVDPQQVGGDYLADGPRVDGAVGVAADAGIDRAVVHASTAADALQGLAQLFVPIGLAAAVVEQHQVHLVRAVQLPCPARAADDVEIGGDGLAGGRAGQGTVKRRHVGEELHHLLDAGDGHVHFRHSGAHAPVALVLDEAQAAGLRHREVDAGEPHAGAAKLFAQGPPPGLDQGVHIGGGGKAFEVMGEGVTHLLLVLVDGGHDDVGRGIAVELDDKLPHIALKAADAVARHLVVEAHLLAHHGLALDDGTHPVLLGDAEDDGVGLGRRLGPVHPDAVALAVGFELLQEFRQAREAALANLLGRIAHRRLFPRIGEGVPPLAAQVIHGAAKVLAQHGVGQGRLGLGMEAARRILGVLTHDGPPVFALASTEPPARYGRAGSWPDGWREAACPDRPGIL